MRKAFIKFKAVTGYSETHNQRKIEPKYLVKPERENVEIFNSCSIAEKRAELEKLVKQKTGRKMQKKAVPIREAVVVLPDDDNEYNKEVLKHLSAELKSKYKINCFQAYIHNDEGFTDENGNISYNYHAHLVFDWIDHQTGKSARLSKEDMSNIQTLNAEILGMERGKEGSENLSLDHHRYREFKATCRILEKKLGVELTREQEQEVRREIKNKVEPLITKDGQQINKGEKVWILDEEELLAREIILDENTNRSSITFYERENMEKWMFSASGMKYKEELLAKEKNKDEGFSF